MMREYSSEGYPSFPETVYSDIRSDWPDMSHVRQVMVRCEQCHHRKPANLGGYSVPVVLCAGDESRFRWTGGTVSVRRWRAIEAAGHVVGRGWCPDCGWTTMLAAGISERSNGE